MGGLFVHLNVIVQPTLMAIVDFSRENNMGLTKQDKGVRPSLPR